MSALKFLMSQMDIYPAMAGWYADLAMLYRQQLWDQLVIKLEQFSAVAIATAGDALIQLYYNFVSDVSTSLNPLKFSQFAVIVSMQYQSRDSSVAFLEGVIGKLRATQAFRVDEPVLYVKMQIAALRLQAGHQSLCKLILEEAKAILEKLPDADPSVHASVHWVTSQYHKEREEHAEAHSSYLLYLVYMEMESMGPTAPPAPSPSRDASVIPPPPPQMPPLHVAAQGYATHFRYPVLPLPPRESRVVTLKEKKLIARDKHARPEEAQKKKRFRLFEESIRRESQKARLEPPHGTGAPLTSQHNGNHEEIPALTEPTKAPQNGTTLAEGLGNLTALATGVDPSVGGPENPIELT